MPETETTQHEAAVWLATTKAEDRPRAIVPHIQKTFGLTAAAAIAAIRESQLIKARSL